MDATKVFASSRALLIMIVPVVSKSLLIVEDIRDSRIVFIVLMLSFIFDS
jgi:hypothetical protein